MVVRINGASHKLFNKGMYGKGFYGAAAAYRSAQVEKLCANHPALQRHAVIRYALETETPEYDENLEHYAYVRTDCFDENRSGGLEKDEFINATWSTFSENPAVKPIQKWKDMITGRMIERPIKNPANFETAFTTLDWNDNKKIEPFEWAAYVQLTDGILDMVEEYENELRLDSYTTQLGVATRKFLRKSVDTIEKQEFNTRTAVFDGEMTDYEAALSKKMIMEDNFKIIKNILNGIITTNRMHAWKQPKQLVPSAGENTL